MALHEQCVGATDEWYTPPYVFAAMGCRFDLDVAHPGKPFANWIPADRYITEDSLNESWNGYVWMNPPFGRRNAIIPWLDKFYRHHDGVALTPDRTSAPWWQTCVPKMDLILFVAPKIKFIGRDGEPGCSPAQGTTLMALGEKGCSALRRAAASGLGSLFEPAAGRSSVIDECQRSPVLAPVINEGDFDEPITIADRDGPRRKPDLDHVDIRQSAMPTAA